MINRWLIAIMVSFALHSLLGVYFIVNEKTDVPDKPALSGSLEMRLSDFKTQPVPKSKPEKLNTATETVPQKTPAPTQTTPEPKPAKEVPIKKAAQNPKTTIAKKKINKLPLVEEKPPEKVTLAKNTVPAAVNIEVPTQEKPIDRTSTFERKSTNQTELETQNVAMLKTPEAMPSKLDPADRLTMDKPEKEIKPEKEPSLSSNKPPELNNPQLAKSTDQFTESGLLIITDPIYLKRNQPVYPRRAIKKNQQGQVIIEATLDTHGYVIDMDIFQSSGFKLLDRSALKAVKDWQFEPARRNGAQIMSVVRIPVNYQLEEHL